MTPRIAPNQLPPGVPIGVPTVFLWPLAHARTGEHLPAALARLVAEYDGAHGHVFDWGHIVVTQRPPLTTWRIVPVALWEQLARERPVDALNVPTLVARLAPLVRERLAPGLPTGLHVAGVHRGAGRRWPHSLLTLLQDDPRTLPQAWLWIERELLRQRLPALLQRAPAALLEPPALARPRRATQPGLRDTTVVTARSTKTKTIA
jgi:hypothetical protein